MRDARHTAATPLLLQQGVAPRVAMQLLDNMAYDSQACTYDAVVQFAMDEEESDGTPLADLLSTEIDWTDNREHVEQRDVRTGTDELAPSVEWATEACAHPDRLVGRTTSAVFVVGRSPSCDRILRVVLQPVDAPATVAGSV